MATVREMLAEAEREGLGRRGYFYRGVGPCVASLLRDHVGE